MNELPIGSRKFLCDQCRHRAGAPVSGVLDAPDHALRQRDGGLVLDCGASCDPPTRRA